MEGSLYDLDLNHADDDDNNSNASDESFVHNNKNTKRNMITTKKEMNISQPTKLKQIISRT